jgi:ketosteroid isomerase-like protein
MACSRSIPTISCHIRLRRHCSRGPIRRTAPWKVFAPGLAGFDGPVQLTSRDPVVSQDGDLAIAHTLTKMTATRAGQHESISIWYRSTFGLRRIDGSWRITHRHDSTPFYMDGSYRAATDLEP